MQEVYNNKMVHRDLKPENVFIHNGVYKIADFGFSKIMKASNKQVRESLVCQTCENDTISGSVNVYYYVGLPSGSDVFNVRVLAFPVHIQCWPPQIARLRMICF